MAVTQKDYYSILDVPKNSSEEDIKKAYRKLSMKHHPDKNLGKGSEILLDIQEAYSVLVNSRSRSIYDNTKTTVSSARTRKGADLSITLKVTAAEIAGEMRKNIVVTRSVLCPDCNGTGSQTKCLELCYKCNGKGYDIVSTVIGAKKFCEVCNGYGTIQEHKDCKKCKGTGLVNGTITRQIQLSRDFRPNITIPQSGHYALGSSIPGNLNISFIVQKTGSFSTEGKNIKGPLKISPAQAVLGDIVFIEVFGNPEKVIVPAGIKHGETIEKERLGTKKGLFIFRVFIDIPKNISNEEKELYTKLLKIQKGFL